MLHGAVLRQDDAAALGLPCGGFKAFGELEGLLDGQLQVVDVGRTEVHQHLAVLGDAERTRLEDQQRRLELRVEPLLPEELDPSSLTPDQLQYIRERVEANALWTGFLISKDRATAAIQVRLRSAEGEDAARLEKVVDGIVAEVEAAR